MVDIPSILRANLFGKAEVAASDENAPATSLSLTLTGVIADTDPAKGFALIGPAGSPVRVYAVGSSIPGGVKLHAVYPDRVLLDRNGAIEALLMPKRSSIGAPLPPQLAAPPNVAERVQQLVRNNPSMIGDIIRPQAVLADGKQRGYRVYPGPNAQAFTSLGLRPGDLVTAINGTALDDPARGGEIFATLGSVAEARVTVVRNGSQQELPLNLALAVQEAERSVANQTNALPPTNPVQTALPPGANALAPLPVPVPGQPLQVPGQMPLPPSSLGATSVAPNANQSR